ncbi:MAG TPA: transcriptional regulator [Kiritimatiellae bacterium]|nr:transcriptional regulator [Kiritimatiellia bacterium]
MEQSPSGRGPSLWRTCRALANVRRLRLFQILLVDGEKSVSDSAARTGLPLSQTSQYLRALNARGLLRARRLGRNTLYSVAADRLVPFAEDLVEALVDTFAEQADPVDYVFHHVTAFTHFRREKIVAVLRRGPATKSDLEQALSLSRAALERHLRKLIRRGYVIRTGRRYRLTTFEQPLPLVLVKWASITL